MIDNQLTYILLGAIGQLILWLSYKILKKPKIYFSLLFLTILIALFGYLNIDRESLQMANGNAAQWTFFPLLFMIYYWIFRQLFLKIYKSEPLMVSYMETYSAEAVYRRLHIGDLIFTLSTLMLPFLTTLLF